MQPTYTHLNYFDGLDKQDKSSWNGTIIAFIADVTNNAISDDQKRFYRDLFDFIDDDDWDKLKKGEQVPSDILGEDGLKDMVKFGSDLVLYLKKTAEAVDEFNNGTDNDTTLILINSYYIIPGTSEKIRETVANFFVDSLNISDEIKAKIVPKELFGDDITNPKDVDDIYKDVKAIINASSAKQVEAIAKQKNFSRDKFIKWQKLQNATRKAQALALPVNKSVANTDYLNVDPANVDDHSIEIQAIDFSPDYDTEIVFDDNGVKSLAMAILIVFPGLMNSLLLNRKFLIGMSDNFSIDGINISEMKRLQNKVINMDMNDGDEVIDVVSSLFLIASYKLLVLYQNDLFSDKVFNESRFYMFDMVLLYFGVGVRVDGFLIGDETNVYKDTIKLDGGKITIKREEFTKVDRGRFNEYYEIRKIPTGRFYHYYDDKYEWGKGTQYFEKEFWKNVIRNKSGVNDCGHKLLHRFKV